MDTVGLPLKVFVVGAGVLLVIGTIVLGVLVVLGISGQRPGPAPVVSDVAAMAEALPLPAGARIEQVVPDPSGGPLILLGVDAGDAPFLALVDLEQGTLVRLIRFEPEAAR
ncbi:MAG: hypothetical protein R3349_09230 [Geminicoccaceae bacterium]|nr:hypothetical protein [Geminicoccaceae bacterium]